MDIQWTNDTMEKVLNKVEFMLERIGDKIPHVCKDNEYDSRPISWWTSGFWPGILWIAYQYSKLEKYKNAAIKIEEQMDKNLHGFYSMDHDAGFLWQLSAGANYLLTNNDESKKRCLHAASILASRYNLKGNFIQAWNHENGWAIIDCCMNLPLLFWASEVTGNPRYRYFAEGHANTVLKYFVRADGSTNHIVSFNAETGEFIKTLGGQGNAPDSAWARGASWAIYGLALAYRYTKNNDFLTAAKNVSHFFLANLPEDNVPYWDFRVEINKETPRDTSAAACAACGLLEISEFVPEIEKKFYINSANKILVALTEKYSNLCTNEKECILNQGTGHLPNNENINVGLIYGDYFYIEAISRLNGNKNIFWYGK